jgi:predicted amino acid-binding ACT domain protein
VPELEAALRDRRDDPFLLDPTGLHRWDTVERLHEYVRSAEGAEQWERCRDRDAVRLAAFLTDALRDRDDRVPTTRTLVERLELGARAERKVATLGDDPRLLLDAARHRSSFEEPAVMQLAAHYGDVETARGAYVLSGALADDSFDGHAVAELYGFVHAVLKAANWDRETANVVERRRREAELASEGSKEVLDRIADAPRAYLLAERPRRIARHMALLADWKRGRGDYLVNVEPPTRHDPRIEVELVTRDRPGLLARVARVLADAGLDIEHAIVATWPDGRALESFLVSSAEVPDPDLLREAVKRAAGEPLGFTEAPEAMVEFDDGASPWYTVCRVRAANATGLLAAVTGAIAAAEVDVHSAEVGTDEDGAVDTFEVTGARGKLLPDERAALVENLRRGGFLGAPPRRVHRAWDKFLSTWSSASDQTVDIQA